MLNVKQLHKLLEFIDLDFICQRNDQKHAQSKNRVFRKIQKEKTKQQTFCGILKKSQANLHIFSN